MKQILNKLRRLPIDQILFIIFVFSIPFQTRIIFNSDQAYIGSLFSYHKAIFLYGTDVLFLLFIILSQIKKENSYKPSKWLLLAVFGGLTSLFHVEQFGLYWFYLVKLIQFWLIVDYIKQSTISTRVIGYAIAFSGFIQALIAIVQFHEQQSLNLAFLGEYLPKSTDLGAATIQIGGDLILRAYGTFPHPNVLGGFLAIALIFVFWISHETKKSWHIALNTIMALVITWGLALSFSRSAWIAAILGFTVFVLHEIWNKRIKTLVFVGILAIVSCGTIWFGYNQYLNPRISDISSESKAIEYRSEFNKQGYELFALHPITGLGLGQYSYYHESMFHVEQWQHQPPHIAILHLLAQFGLIGLLASAIVYLKLGFTWNNVKKGLNISLILALIVISALDHYLVSIQQGLLIFALVCGIIIKIDVSQSVKHLPNEQE